MPKKILTLREKALRYLGRPRTAAELRQFLVRQAAAGEEISALLAECREKKYLDDAAEAERFVQACRRRGYGAAELKRRLMARGIDRPVIDAAMADAAAATPEEDVARVLLAKISRKPPEKQAQFLLRRGFPPRLVRQLISQVAEKLADGDS